MAGRRLVDQEFELRQDTQDGSKINSRSSLVRIRLSEIALPVINIPLFHFQNLHCDVLSGSSTSICRLFLPTATISTERVSALQAVKQVGMNVIT
jgi:hypothetical protein